jgi:hypothetical protein
LTPLTAFICVVKENAGAILEEGYLLKMKNALEGISTLSALRATIFVKTLTGKTIEIDTNLNITIQEMK